MIQAVRRKAATETAAVMIALVSSAIGLPLHRRINRTWTT
jgi:hypothetical protein